MLIRDVMTTDLVTCPVETSLCEGVERMLRNSVGNVMVREKERLAGVVTETDALHAGYAAQRSFTEIPIRKVMSDTLITTSPDRTLRRATQRMREAEMKKLVVVGELDPVGIITTQDMLDNYSDIKAGVGDLA